MTDSIATSIAHPNIALIKYWGDVLPELHIPANGSISMNLEELRTRTTVHFVAGLHQDQLVLNTKTMHGEALERVSTFLDRVRELAGIRTKADVESDTNFPIAAGLASSAAGFAALSLAACKAAGLELDEPALSRMARRGSGSACRSVPEGFVEWQAGKADVDSYAFSIALANHWDLVDCIALVSQEEKMTSSNLGHAIAQTSPLQKARITDAPKRLEMCRQAIAGRDFDELAAIVELDSNMMHAVMITSTPALIYWQAGTVTVMQAVQTWRKQGVPACYSIDAGPNVHVLCPATQQEVIVNGLQHLPGVMRVLTAHPGGLACLVDQSTP